MDPHLDRRRDHLPGRLRCQQSSPTLQQAPVRPPGPPSSDPVSQRQWEHVPLPYRPREWRDPSEALPREPVPEPLFAWRLRPTADEPPRRTDATRQRRRPGALRHLFSRHDLKHQGQAADASHLYPQMSPYDEQASSLSAPDELENFPRSVSQPNTPSYWPPPPPGDDSNEPSLAMIPRSPTYPPASQRRVRSTTNIADTTTFTDQNEFSLFVQATAGFMPEPTWRAPDIAPAPSRNNNQGPLEETTYLQSPASDRIVSPLGETPTTMYALQQLAQLPHGTHGSGQREIQVPQPLTRAQIANEAAMGGVDLWIEPPSPTYDEDDVSPNIDEELPDYASSQQQAQAAQIAEATRRAQELQRRWRQSQGNY